MTVAAVLVADPVDLLDRSTDGWRWLDRLVDAAWAGGALPILIAAADPPRELPQLLEGRPVRAAPVATMTVQALLAAALNAGRDAVADLSAVLLWPAEMVWVEPETITSLIEHHGRAPRAVLRPAFDGRPGWPVLIPTEIGAAQTGATVAGPAGDAPREAGTGRWEAALGPILAAVEVRVVELGDPGAVFDGTTPLADLPPYQGPPKPGSLPPDGEGVVAAALEAIAREREDRRP